MEGGSSLQNTEAPFCIDDELECGAIAWEGAPLTVSVEAGEMQYSRFVATKTFLSFIALVEAMRDTLRPYSRNMREAIHNKKTPKFENFSIICRNWMETLESHRPQPKASAPIKCCYCPCFGYSWSLSPDISLESQLIEKVSSSLTMAQFIYGTYKENANSDSLKRMLSETIEVLRLCDEYVHVFYDTCSPFLPSYRHDSHRYYATPDRQLHYQIAALVGSTSISSPIDGNGGGGGGGGLSDHEAKKE